MRNKIPKCRWWSPNGFSVFGFSEGWNFRRSWNWEHKVAFPQSQIDMWKNNFFTFFMTNTHLTTTLNWTNYPTRTSEKGGKKERKPGRKRIDQFFNDGFINTKPKIKNKFKNRKKREIARTHRLLACCISASRVFTDSLKEDICGCCFCHIFQPFCWGFWGERQKLEQRMMKKCGLFWWGLL